MHWEGQSATHKFTVIGDREVSEARRGGPLALFFAYKCADAWEVHPLLEHNDRRIEGDRNVFDL
jgi:hypothetical protein